MKSRVAWLALAALALVAGSATAQVQRTWSNSNTNNSYWSNSGNWSGGEIADTNGEWAQLNAPVCELDANFTINRIQNSFGTTNGGVTGTGTLTIDRNTNSLQTAIINVRGKDGIGVVFTLDCNIVITNSLGGISTVQNNNLNSNVVRFGTNSVLTLNSRLQTVNSAGGMIEFNGALAGGSSVNTLAFGSSNVVFGSTADNAGFNGDFVFNANSRAVANIDGGLLLKKGRKVQVNGVGGKLELNGTNILDANINIGGSNVFTLVANASQDDVGFVDFVTGGLVIDLGPETSELLFDDSHVKDWSGGFLVISNFASGVIGFGVSSNGLTAGQLAVISAYDSAGALVPDLAIDASGYLTGTVTGDPGPGPVEVGDIALDLISGGSAVAISWASTNGANYGVSNTADLVFGPWTLLTNGVIGTGGSLSITNPTDQSVEFFKVYSE